MTASSWKNKLYFGDNLTILREYLPDESVDLIYLDPPFNSAANYNVLFKEHGGEQSAAQITAFEDTWHWTQESEAMYQNLVTTAPESLASLIQALRSFLHNSDMMAYLTMMASRLIELHRVLKETGSIYLHCDPTASHYLKLLLDAIFGVMNFKTEIVWKRTNIHNDSKSWSGIADTILYYVKDADSDFTWNPIYQQHSAEHLESKYRAKDEQGRAYTLSDMTSPSPRPNMMYEWKGFASPPRGWRYSLETMTKLDAEGRVWYPADRNKRPRLKRFLDEMQGTILSNIWTDISPLNSQAKERLGYPTQKPEALLERIITASSNEGDMVLDPFCGCGTSINVAERLHRRWIGIDITHLAVSLIKSRLHDTFGSELAPYEVIGDPKDVASAEALALSGLDGRYQFQWWAVGLVEGRPAQDKKKGKDTGIDGFAYFFDDNSGAAKKIIIQVKSGNVKSGDIRDLKGVLEREKAQIGAFITLKPSTKDMRTEAVSAGYYESPHFGNFPKLQILTIEELLHGAKLLHPRGGGATFKRAERQSKNKGEQEGLF
jgi:site-specific DNA-methyltransferase (adenine-specific)